jgi:hypothetical protein
LKLQLDANHSGTEVLTRTAKKRENGGLPRKAAATKTRQEAASEWRALVLRLDLGKKEGPTNEGAGFVPGKKADATTKWLRGLGELVLGAYLTPEGVSYRLGKQFAMEGWTALGVRSRRDGGFRW